MVSRWIWVLIFLSACAGRDCSLGESIVVKYRGQNNIETNAKVFRGDTASGYIKESLASDDLQRVVVRVNRAADFTTKDRWVPFKDDSGKLGFKVEAGPGSPLANGDEVEADPSWSLREQYAAMGGPITLPSGAFIPFPKMLTRERVDPSIRREERGKKKIADTFRMDERRPSELDPAMRQRITAFGESLKSKSMEEIHSAVKIEGEQLKQDLEALEEQEIKNGNRQAAREAGRMAGRIDHLQRRIEREDAKAARGKVRKPRENYMPPEFR